MRASGVPLNSIATTRATCTCTTETVLHWNILTRAARIPSVA